MKFSIIVLAVLPFLKVVEFTVNAESSDLCKCTSGKRCTHKYVCPPLHSLSSVRGAMAASSVKSFQQCTRLFVHRPTSHARLNFTLQEIQKEAEQLFAVSLQVCDDVVCGEAFASIQSDAENSTHDQAREGHCACQNRTREQRAKLISRGRCLLHQWLGSCLSTSAQLFTQSNSPSSGKSVGQADATLAAHASQLSYCLGLLREFSNITQTSAMVSCKALPLVSTYSNRTATSVVRRLTSLCSGFSGSLSNLVLLVENESCLGLFVADMSIVVSKLDVIYAQLRQKSLGTLVHSPTKIVSLLHQFHQTLCYGLFQENGTCTQPVPRKLCPAECHELRNTLSLTKEFLDFKQASSLRFLLEVVNETCLPLKPSSQLDHKCISTDGTNSTGITCTSKKGEETNKALTQPKLCFNLKCHFPLKETTVRRHWFTEALTYTESLGHGLSILFPNVSLADAKDGASFPCGMACTTDLFFDSKYKSAIRLIAFISGSLVMACSILAVVAFFLNRKKLSCLPRRMIIYFNIAYLFGHGSDTLLAGMADASKNIPCYEDGTIRFEEPVNGGSSLCAFLAWKLVFGSIFMASIFLAICHEWHSMISTLKQPMRVRGSITDSKSEQLREVCYVSAATCVSAAMATGPLIRRTIVGFPSHNSCFLTEEDQFYFFGLPIGVLVTAMIGYLLHGMPALLHTYKGMRGYAKRVQLALTREMSQTNSRGRRRRRSVQGLELLISLLSVYIIGVIASQVALLPVFTYVFTVRHKVEQSLQSYIECLLMRCDPSDCPHWQQLHPAVVILPDLLGNSVGFILSCWALNWRTYWKPHILACFQKKHVEPAHQQNSASTVERTLMSTASSSKH